MPVRPPRPCSFTGCPDLVYGPGRHCETHKAQVEREYRSQAHVKESAKAYDKARGTAARRGYNSRWQRYRARYLREHPLCVRCLAKGIITPSTEVDHIEAVTGPNDPGFWNPANHQALCKTCHSQKTGREDRPQGKGRAKG